MSPAPLQPNFLVVGAAKAGTSTLWHWLSRHPQVFMSQNKEPCYFVRGTGLDRWDEYLALFAPAHGKVRLGEASASYLAAPESPAWIRETLGSIDIVIVLRNPVQRAYSLYGWMVMEGYEPIEDFEAALAEEPRRLASDTFRQTCPQYFDDYLYFSTGLYHDQVKRYFDVFGRDRVHVCLFDDLVKDPVAFYAGVCGFLGLSPSGPIEPEPKNVTVLPRSIARQVRLRSLRIAARKKFGRFLGKPFTLVCDALMKLNNARGEKRPLPPAVKAQLIERYRDDVTRLSALIGRDLSPWLKP